MKNIFIYCVVALFIISCAPHKIGETKNTQVTSIDICKSIDINAIVERNETTEKLYAFLDIQLNQGLAVCKYQKKDSIEWKILRSNKLVFFIFNNNFYVTTAWLKTVPSKSHFVGLLLHELHHYISRLRYTLVDVNNLEKNCNDTVNLNSHLKSLYTGVRWIAEEKEADMLVMEALQNMGYSSKVWADLLTHNPAFLNVECRQNIPQRVTMMNEYWLGLGMPSNYYQKAEYSPLVDRLP